MKSSLNFSGFCARRTSPLPSVIRPITALIFLVSLTSCIYDAPCDEFYRTLWTSEEAPFNYAAPYKADNSALVTDKTRSEKPNGLTLEFLCGGSARILATGAAGSYGKYEHHGSTAYFAELHLTYNNNGSPSIIIIEEAHRTDELLLISWHYSGSATSYSTRMIRKSSYDK